MCPSPQIVFFKFRSFSQINQHVLRELQKGFPGATVLSIDVDRDLVAVRSLQNLFHVLKLYGMDFLRQKRSLRAEFSSRTILVRTPYYYQQVKRAVAKWNSGRKIWFSFQTQSLFDTSTRGIPHFIYTDHTHLANLRYPGFDSHTLFSPEWIHLEKEAYHNAALIFTTAEFTSQSLVEDYGIPEQRIYCVHSGVNVDVPDRDLKRDYASKNILFVGVEWERKGGPDLVETFCSLLLQHPNARLTIVGCSPQIDHPNTHVVGRVPLQEMPAYYQDASVFCLPSRVEPSASALTEAAAFGLPVVSTRIGGTPQRVLHGETGYLIEPGDQKGLKAALSELLSDPVKCQTFGERGRQLVHENFSWDVVGQKICGHIRDWLTYHGRSNI